MTQVVTPPPVNHVRRAQVLAEIRALRKQFNRWFRARTKSDQDDNGSPRGQYRSQLAALRAEVLGAARIISESIRTLDVSGSSGSVYERCARIERQIIWLWRVWLFFRDKFDQRDDPRYKELLLAADEVVWSCFSPFFQHEETSGLTEPPPLPYVEADYSPSALRRDQRDALQRRGPDFVLVQKAFQKLPVALLKVPITSVGNPWALVLIGHETGHVIQPLIPGGEKPFPEVFQDRIEGVVRDQGGSGDDAKRWKNWAPEIFADWYSVVTMGQWAIWAMAQFEIADPTVMATRRTAYPAPVVRLALLAALADEYDMPGSRVLDDLQIDVATIAAIDAETARDVTYIDAVVAAIMSSIPETLPPLETIVGLNATDYGVADPDRDAPIPGAVQQWADYLLQPAGAAPESKKRNSARLVAAGTAQAWWDGVFVRGAANPAALRTAALKAMRDAAMPGVRSAAAPDVVRPDAGRDLAKFLEHFEDDSLEDDAPSE